MVGNLRLAFEGELSLKPLGNDIVAITIGSAGAGWTSFRSKIVIGADASIEFYDIPIGIRISRDILQPMKRVIKPDGSKVFEADKSKQTVDIDLGSVKLIIGGETLIEIQRQELQSTALPLCMVGESGVVPRSQHYPLAQLQRYNC